jgi:hypothetical protein
MTFGPHQTHNSQAANAAAANQLRQMIYGQQQQMMQ